MLVVVLAANLLLENFVEPKVMGRSLDIHPLVVLVVTALGGIVGGIVGLILAVPVYVIARTAIGLLRSGGFFKQGGRPGRTDGATAARVMTTLQDLSTPRRRWLIARGLLRVAGHRGGHGRPVLRPSAGSPLRHGRARAGRARGRGGGVDRSDH